MTAPAESTTKPGTSLVRRLTESARRGLALVRKSTRKLEPIYPATPFDDWTYGDVEDELGDVLQNQRIDQTAREERRVQIVAGEAFYPQPRRFQDPIVINRAFFEGDHWQEGSGWVGPHPKTGEIGYDDAMREIALAFTSKNVVREVVLRHAAGVVGNVPQWSFVPKRPLADDEQPNTDEQAAIKLATELMTNWLKGRKAHKTLFDAVCTTLFAERGPLRLYVPPGWVQENADGSTTIVAKTIADGLKIIWPDHPKPEHAAVIEDEDTKLECGVRLYESDVDNDEKDEACAELTYLDQYGRTVLRHVDDGDDDDADDGFDVRIELDMGGRLTMFEMHRNAIVTPQVQQHQRALNLALSVLPRTIVTAGFLERVLLNAQMPGTWEVDVSGRKTGRFIPGKIKFGAGTTVALSGLEVGEDEQGNAKVVTPDVKWRDPVDPKGTIAAAAAHYMAILEEVRQLHAIMSGDSNISGKSREEARKEFLQTLIESEPEAEAAWTFLLEGPLALAEAFAGTPGKLTNLIRAQVDCRLDTGPLSKDELDALVAQIGKTRSQETIMAMVGVDDVAAELAKMSKDPASVAALKLAQGTAMVQLTTAGASLIGAAKAVGISAEDAKALLDGQEFEQQPTAPNTPTPRKRLAPGQNEPTQEPKTKPNEPATGGGTGGGTRGDVRQTSASGSSGGGE